MVFACLVVQIVIAALRLVALSVKLTIFSQLYSRVQSLVYTLALHVLREIRLPVSVVTQDSIMMLLLKDVFLIFPATHI